MPEFNRAYFDTNFLRRLIGLPADPDHRVWQEYFFETLNKQFLPFTCLCSSLQFLELIGIVPPHRPQLKGLIPDNWRELERKAVGKIISDRSAEIIREAEQYYSEQKILSTGELISRSNIQANKFTAQNPFARLLANETFQRYKAKDRFDEMLYQALALDHLQQQLLYEPKCDVMALAQLTILKDFLGVFAEGYNVALFRLLRNIFVSAEPELFGDRRFTIVPLDGRQDLVDTEYLHFALLGLLENGINTSVTVFTGDSPQQVKTRIKIAKYIYQLFTADRLKTLLPRCNIVLPTLKPGRIVCCSLSSPKIEEIIVVEDIDFEIELPDATHNKRIHQISRPVNS